MLGQSQSKKKLEKDGMNMDRMRWILNLQECDPFTNDGTENDDHYYL